MLPFTLYSQHRLISPRLIEHSRKINKFSRIRTTPLKIIGNFFAYYHRNNITSPNITEIQGPQRPYLARIITLCFNWSEWANQLTGYFRWLRMPIF